MAGAIIFDFDGVIVLSSKPRFDALQKVARRYMVEIDDALFVKSIGRTTEDFMRQNFPDLDNNKFEKVLADYRTEYKDKVINYTVPVPFTNEFIRTYKGDCSLAVASANSVSTLRVLLGHLRLDQQLSLIVGREHVSEQKPHPAIYLHTAEKLGLDPSACVVIEDSSVGVLAANRAGMRVYGLLNGTNARADFDSVRVEGFLATLPELESALN